MQLSFALEALCHDDDVLDMFVQGEPVWASQGYRVVSSGTEGPQGEDAAYSSFSSLVSRFLLTSNCSSSKRHVNKQMITYRSPSPQSQSRMSALNVLRKLPGLHGLLPLESVT